MSNHSELSSLIPLFALDALDRAEEAVVEGHLPTCPNCRAELDLHRSVAASFTGEDAILSPGLWSRIETALEIERDAVTSEFPTARPSRLGQVVLAAAAVVALVFGGVLVGQRLVSERVLTSEAIQSAAEATASDSESLVADFLVDGVSVAKVVVGDDGTGYVIPTEALPDLDDDRTYQLWVITPDQLVISAGVLGNRPGPATFTWSDDIAGFALTREVAGGVVSSAGDVASAITDL